MKSKRARDAVVAADGEKQPDVQLAEEPLSKKRKRDNDDVEASADKTKKDKKDKKDKKKKHKGETRKEKKDKRKDLQDLPEQDNAEEEAAAEAEVVKEEKESKKSKKNKDKKSKEAVAETEGAVNGDSEKKELKKKKKNKDKKDEDAGADTSVAASQEANGDAGTNGIDLDESTTQKKDRHIVFVGNLPYTATAATISAHFASLSPIAVRCLTKKGEKNPKVTCKGIAFVEFANVWTQRTCLDKFHHSMFDDKKSAPRKINVELT